LEEEKKSTFFFFFKTNCFRLSFYKLISASQFRVWGNQKILILIFLIINILK
jgi:hypothetical protein